MITKLPFGLYHACRQIKVRTVVKVSVIALLWITIVNPGRIHSDTLVRLQMSHAWWTGTEEVSSQYRPVERGDSIAGVSVGGKRYGVYDPGQSLLMLPGDWVGTQLNRFFNVQSPQDLRPLVVSILIFIPLNVATVVACYWLLRLFDFSERIAGLSSLLWLLGTTVLHYAQFPMQNNQILLCVTLGYAGALACVKQQKWKFALLSGLALGAAILIRTSSIFHVATVGLFLVGGLIYQDRDWVKLLKYFGWWIVGLMPLTLLGRVIDNLRYGSFWATGYTLSQKQMNTDPIYANLPPLPDNYPFTNPPHLGILGVLFSPAKSIFIYDPLLLPSLILAIIFWKRLSPYIHWYLITAFFNLLIHIAFTSRLIFWSGDGAWGARYHVTSVHLLLIPLLAVFVQYLFSVRGWKRWLMRGLITLALLVQIASVILMHPLEARQKSWGVPGTRFEFRLGQRFINIVCLVNGSFSPGCVSRYKSRMTPKKQGEFVKSVEIYNQIYFFPFTFYQDAHGNPTWLRVSYLLFLLWGLLLILAIAITWQFCFLSS